MNSFDTPSNTTSAETLVRRLADRLGITPLEATRALGDLVRFIRSRVEHDGRATVAGLGQFHDSSGALAFEPDDALAAAVNARYAGLGHVAFASGAAPLAYRKHEVVRPSLRGDGHAPSARPTDTSPGGLGDHTVPAEPELSPLSEPPTLTLSPQEATPPVAAPPPPALGAWTERAELATDRPPATEPLAPPPSQPDHARVSPAAEPDPRGVSPSPEPPPSSSPTLDADDDAFWKELDDLERLLRGPLTSEPPTRPAIVPEPGEAHTSAEAEETSPAVPEPRPLDAWLASPTELPKTTAGWALLDADDFDEDLRHPDPPAAEAVAPEPPPLSEPEPVLPDLPGFDLMDLDADDEIEAFAPSPFAPPSAPAAETYGFDELDEASWEEDAFAEQRPKPSLPEVESAWERDPTERMGPPPALTWPSAEPPEPSLQRSEPMRPEPDAYAPPSFDTETLRIPEISEAASTETAPDEPIDEEPAPLAEPEPLAPRPAPLSAPPSLAASAAPFEPEPYAPPHQTYVAPSAASSPDRFDAPAEPSVLPPSESAEPPMEGRRRAVPPRSDRRDGSSGMMIGAILLLVAAAIALAFALDPADTTERAPELTEATRPAQPEAAPTSPEAESADASYPDAPTASETDVAPPPARPVAQPEAERAAAPAPRTLTPALRAALRSSEPLTLPAAGADPSYTLVVLSTPDGDEAQQIAERYRAQGYRTGVVYGPYRDRVRYRVAVGAFATLGEATHARDATRDELPSGAWVMPLRAALDLVAAR